MTLNINELKRLAEDASDAKTIFDPRYRDFATAANDVTVLDLIARIEEAETRNALQQRALDEMRGAQSQDSIRLYALLVAWGVRAASAHPSDAMLINKHIRELKEAYFDDKSTANGAALLTEIESLRQEQAQLVIPLIGPLLDAYEGTQKGDLAELSPDLMHYLKAINQAMEGNKPTANGAGGQG